MLHSSPDVRRVCYEHAECVHGGVLGGEFTTSVPGYLMFLIIEHGVGGYESNLKDLNTRSILLAQLPSDRLNRLGRSLLACYSFYRS
jgi:hypothetical protein